jgi:hypothetical protein
MTKGCTESVAKEFAAVVVALKLKPQNLKGTCRRLNNFELGLANRPSAAVVEALTDC